MIYALCLGFALIAGISAAPTPTEEAESRVINHGEVLSEHLAARGRELFPMLVGTKCARFCDARAGKPAMSEASDQRIVVKGPIKALEMLAMNDDLNTLVASDDMCTRRSAMARAAGLASGLALATVNAPGFAAGTTNVKLGADNGQLVFVPDDIKICKGDTIVWTNNKAGPHNVVFDEEAIPDGVSKDSISMEEGALLQEEGQTFKAKLDVAGAYAYYCEPHRGAGMNGAVTVS